MSVDQAVPRHLSPRSTPRDPGRRIALAAFVVAVAPFVVHAVVWFGGFFGQDDFLITYLAGHGSLLDPGFLFQHYNGHLQPGAFVLAWVVTKAAPLNFAVAIVPLLLMHAATLWLCWRVLTRLFQRRWGLMPLYAVFACSPLVLYPTLWWAYALALLPMLLAMFAALDAHLRYLDGRGGWWAAMLWTVFGLAFYEKAGLIPAVLLGVTTLLAPRAEVGPILWTLRRYRGLWLGFAALLAGFGLLFLALAPSQAHTETVTSRTVLDFVAKSIVDTLLPGLFGGPLTGTSGGATLLTPPLAVRIGSVAIAVAVIVVSAVRARRRVLLPWLFLAAYVTVDLALVGFTRLGMVGPAIGIDPRYLADAVPIAVLCAAFALLPAARLTEEAPAPPAPPTPRTRLVAGVLTVLLITGATVSFVRIAPALQFREARDYVSTARAALAADPGLVLFDAPPPDPVMISWFLDDARTSRVLGMAPENPRFDRPTEDLYRLDATGTPQPIRTLIDPVAAMPGPVPDCGYLVAAETVRIPMADTVSGRRIVRIGYYTADPGIGVVRTGDTSTEVEFAAGLHVVHLVVTGTFTHVDVTRDLDVSPICVTDIQAGSA